MGSGTVIHLPTVSTIIRQVQKELWSWRRGYIQFVLLFEIWRVETESMWFDPHLSKLPTACVCLLKSNENLILGEGTDCVCTWQPTSCSSWDCLWHSMEFMSGLIWQEKKVSVLCKETLNLSASGRNTCTSLSSLFKTLDGTQANISPCHSLQHFVRELNA